MKQTEIGDGIADDAIPEDWEVSLLGDKVDIYRGGSPRPIESYITQNENGINWIKIGDVRPNDKYINSTQERIVPTGANFSREVHKGDFILSNSMSFGRPYILNIDGCIHDGWLTIQNYEKSFDTDFLYYLLSSDGVYKQYVQMAAGSSVQNLNKDKVNELKVVIPPLPEQRRIAQALSDVDSLIATLEKLVAKKTRVKQGAMSLLLSGKTRIENGTFAKCTRFKQTEIGEIPADWEVREVGTLLKVGHGKDYKNLKHGTVPVFGTGGYMTAVSDFLYDGETVCIGRKGTIDKPFFHSGKIWTVDTLFYTYDFVDCIPKFIYYDFCLVDWLSMNEASGVPSLTSKNIESILLPVPPLAEQRRIAQVLSNMDAEITALGAKLAKYRQLKTAMMQQLLTGRIRMVK